ncbi:DUF4920 domain-containing protein [Arenimonas oryziterrae]|uniref:DUF4920 domain-containing protein n=1 Tax=Arenimonas oryziterrae DSM 21050 = YC6267 TaxID=1121015 RepID=A0A091AXD1_9GAMM|nr:DUF4920 domain-containing protein [Arenimonas oryziterrae]KFN44933.1 hypothetical protein N789_02620 [Arenimonas oryziterrae DSM 21050 = YC6267]
MKNLPRDMIGVAAMAASLVLAFSTKAADFGAPLPKGEAVSIDIAAANAQAYADKPQLFAGRITEVCQKEGCWLMIEENGMAARVMVKDHAFAVPKDASGRAVVYGVLSEKAMTPEAAKHMAEDAGHEGHAAHDVLPKEYRILATAVSITAPDRDK